MTIAMLESTKNIDEYGNMRVVKHFEYLVALNLVSNKYVLPQDCYMSIT